MQLSNFKVGDVVVHKSLGSQPLVVTGFTENGYVDVRWAFNGPTGLDDFRVYRLVPEELETPVESIEREAEIFKALNAKRDEINGETGKKPGPVGIKHLN